LIWICIAAGFIAAGCTTNTVSQFDRKGDVQQLVWPSIEHDDRARGTFPNPFGVQAVGKGMTVDQVRSALGSPHFREGYDAREWDYLFHFHRKPPSDDIDSCRYKVIFDSGKHDRQVQAVYWNSEQCANAYGRGAGEPAISSKTLLPLAPLTTATKNTVPTAVTREFDLSMDALFAFNHAELDTILPSGRELLSRLIRELRDEHVRDIIISGYADRLGSPEYNQRLSERRALAIRDYLIANGIEPGIVRTVGHGARDPIVECDALPRTALIRCLAPNRRAMLAVTLSLQP
jgi:outer membrane protein OmpA-like peptidoglycan-associated protein